MPKRRRKDDKPKRPWPTFVGARPGSDARWRDLPKGTTRINRTEALEIQQAARSKQ